jgi:hypothetical protein
MRLSFAFCLAALTTCAWSSAGELIAVSPKGSDSGNGSAEAPYASIDRALKRAKPGDTVALRDGVYAVKARIRATLNGTAQAPITIQAWPKETPVIDGAGIKMDLYDTLFELSKSSHVVVDGLEVRNSAGRGMNLHECTNVTIRNCSIHDVQCRALGGSGAHLLFEGNKVRNACLVNVDNAFPKAGKNGGWPATVQTSMRDDKKPSTDVIFRNNEVRESWGEGIDAWFLDGGAIEGNTIVDCYSVLIYVDTARNLKIDRNVCVSTNERFHRKTPPAGILLSTEHYTFEVPDLADENIVISNNLILNTGRAIGFWCDKTNTKPYNTYRNVQVVHNVVKNCYWEPIGFETVPAGNPAPTGCVARNNIFYKGSKGGSLNIANKEAWTFSNNCWPDGVPDLGKDSTSFKVDPQFVKPDDTTAEGFKLAPTSPCLGKALPLTDVTTDHWGTARRKTQPCVGLHEWMPPGWKPAEKTDQPKKGRLPFVP